MKREEAREWVRFYTSNGLAIVWTDGKEGDAAKRVTRKGWHETRPLAGDLGSLAGQFAERIQKRNPAIVTKPSGIVAVDCDDEEGLAAFLALEPPDTFTVQSSEPYKRHFYFKAPPGTEHFCFEFAAGAVTAKANAYLVCPPATHPSGASYRPLDGAAIAEAPPHLLTRLRLEAGASSTRTTERLQSDPDAKITKGNRHKQLLSIAGTCRAYGHPLETALAIVQAFNAEKCEPPYSEGDVDQKVRDVYERYEAPPVVEIPDEGEVRFDGNLAGLLDDIRATVRRFIVIGAPEAVACALHVAHTHAFDAAEITPYLEIRSAEKRSGKSTLQRVLASMAARPHTTANMSDAVMFRLIEKQTPTLFLDEVDAIFGAKARDREDTRGILNAGFERGATVWRCRGDSHEIEPFNVFSPKVFASIGKLPDTITDRAITIVMVRKHKAEKVERARRAVVKEAGAVLHARLAAWQHTAVDALYSAVPQIPDELNDREQDYWEPLLAIADLAGGHWPQLARRAAVELSQIAAEDPGLLEELLAGIARAFERVNGGNLLTVDLITMLCEDEEAPWRGWWWDEREATPKKEAARRLAQKLRPLGIRSKSVDTPERKAKGYQPEQFEDAWARFEITVTSVTKVTGKGQFGLNPRENEKSGDPGDPSDPLSGEVDAYAQYLLETHADVYDPPPE